jgi:hypothetical protein
MSAVLGQEDKPKKYIKIIRGFTSVADPKLLILDPDPTFQSSTVPTDPDPTFRYLYR